MTLHKSMWKAAVLMGIAGVLMFAGGAFAALSFTTAPAAPSAFTYGDANKATTAAVVAGATGTASYKWFKVTSSSTTPTGGTAVDGATALSLDLSAQSLDAGTHYYYLQAIDTKDDEVVETKNSGTITVTVSKVPAAKVVDFTKFATASTGDDAVFTGKTRSVVSGITALTTTNSPVLTKADGRADLGTQTVYYRKPAIGASAAGSWQLTIPLDTTTSASPYQVCVTTASTINYEATTTSTSPIIFTSGVTVTNKLLSASAVNNKDTTVVFNATGRYAINGPVLWSDDDGTKDTIIYTTVVHKKNSATTGLTGDQLPKIEKVTDKGAKYELVFARGAADVDTGYVEVSFEIKGKAKDPKVNWSTAGAGLSVTTKLVQKISIKPKAIADGDVSVPTGADIVYNGNDQTPPRIVVRDGTRNLTEAVYFASNGTTPAYNTLNDFTVNKIPNAAADNWITIAGMTPASAANNRKNAGDAYVFVQGQGNYTGVAKCKFPIVKAPLTVAVNAILPKTYDGTSAIDTISAGKTTELGANKIGNINVTLTGMVTPSFQADGTTTNTTPEALANVTDYIITNAKFDSTNVSAAGTVTASATVTLVSSANNIGRNYSLASGAVSSSTNASITQREPGAYTDGTGTWPYGDSLTFSYTIPKRYFKDAIQAGMNAVAFRSPIASPGATLRTVYGYTVDKYFYTSATDSTKVTTEMVNGQADAVSKASGKFDTTFAPRNTDSYPVSVRVLEATSGASKNVKAGTYKLGVYVIEAPVPPNITSPTAAQAVTVRQNRYPVLTVTATSPNGGTLSYKWGRVCGDNCVDTIVGATSATFTAPTGVAGSTVSYVAIVINRKPSDQIDGVKKSEPFNVTFDPPATLVTGKLDIKLANDTLTYSGFGITPMGADLVVRYFVPPADPASDTSWTPLTAGTDYTATYARNVNVGRADIIIVAQGNYEGSATKNFQIVPKELTMNDLAYTATRPYDGSNKGANVKLADPKTGAGTLTVKFDGDTLEPKLPGLYMVEVSATAGTNFKAAPAPGFWLGMYQITKGKIDSSSFAYTIPTNHVEGVTTVFGIGPVTFVKGEGYGTITILYNGDTTVPKKAGTYIVSADISGGQYYDADEATLGNYTIKTAVSVAQGNREVPKSGETNVVSVAPVKVKPAAALTAGPSPVKLGGEIKFFSKSVKSAIYIFDASGSSVAKLPAKPGKDGAVAVWNLKDKKGVAVSEGTYVAVAKAGSEKVSFRFSVVK